MLKREDYMMIQKNVSKGVYLRDIAAQGPSAGETTALLALKKKLNALWEDDNGDA